MKLHNLKQVQDYEVEKWIKEKFNLNPAQISEMNYKETVSRSPFYFFKSKEKIKQPLLRLTIIFMPFVWLILFCCIPFIFLMKGQWGWKYNQLNWFLNWQQSLGI